MAHLFLDANCLIDLLEGRDLELAALLEGHQLYTCALSVHILTYVGKYRMPAKVLAQAVDYFSVCSMNQDCVKKSLQGPTPDFEDNVQLHAAHSAGCEYFLTRDEGLLKLGEFEGMRVVARRNLFEHPM